MSSMSRAIKFRSLRRWLPAAALALVLCAFQPIPEVRADTLREVAQQVAREHNAKVVSARVVERNGRKFYEIRILTRDGVVRTVRVPAREARQ